MANGNNRDVNLRIRAKDETGPGVKSAQTALSRFAAAQQRTQSRRDLYAGATQSAKDMTAAYKAATEQATKFGRQMDDVKNWRWSDEVVENPAELARNFEESRAAARRAKTEYLEAGAALARMQGKQGGFAAFDQIAIDAKKADAAIDNVTSSLDRMTAAQRRAATATKAARKGDLAEQITGAYTSKQGRGPLGLRPYELQNLGYQINDLFTQIASGTSPMQAFAQQGGQIAQLFPKATTAILRFSPAIAAAALVVSPFVVALKQLGDEAKRLDAVNQAMAVSGNAADYAKKDLIDYAATLQDLGLKATEVGGVINTSLREGLRPEYFDRFATSAKGLSKVTGDELAASMNEVTEAFTGNADQVLALDDKLGFLSRTERKHIEQLREAKKDADARTEAFAIFERKYGAIAAKMDGSWDRILDNFGDAWGAFGKLLLDGIQWDAIKTQIGGILAMIAELTAKLPGVKRSEREALASQHAGYDRQLATLEGRPDGGSTRGGRGGPTVAEERQRIARERDAVIRRITEIDKAKVAAQPELPDTTIDPPNPANTDSGRDREAERLAKRQREYIEGLKEANDQREFELSLLSKAEREAEILREIEKARNAARDVGLSLTEDQTQAIRDSVGALYDSKKIQGALEIVERTRLRLAEARNQREERSAAIAREMKAAGFNPGTIKDRAGLISEGNIDLANRPVAVNEDGSISTVRSISIEVDGEVVLIPTVGPDGSVLSDEDAIDLFEASGKNLGIFQTLDAAEKYAEELHAAQEVFYSDAVQNYKSMLGQLYDLEDKKRQQLLLEKALADQQAIQQELQQQIATAADAGDNTRVSSLQEQLTRVNGSLLQAIGNILEFWRTQSGPEAEAAILKWEGIEEAIKTAGQKAIVTGTQIDQMLAQGGANAFDQFAESLAEGANVFDSLRDAFLQFAADFLRQIAQMIAQQLLLNALGASNGKASGTGSAISGFLNGLFGSKHTGGLVGHGGGFKTAAIAAFAGATRYHSGGIAGLAPNEVPAILLRNEEVLTEDDPRHRANGGLGASGKGSVKVINVFDPADALDRGLETEKGERSFFNFVRRNSGTFKALLA